MSISGSHHLWLAKEWAGSAQLHQWYSAADGVEGSLVGHEAVKDAFDAFSTELSKDKDKSKLHWITNPKHGNLGSVLASVAEARALYEKRKGDSKVRQLLVSVPEKIHHYSGIVDVFVSHHPEYTALVWGAMKALFVGVVNHEKVIHRLSEGLVQIADLLPRAELTVRLYPIPPLRQTITKMYSHVLKFLVRALGWYQESKLMHALHSVTRPAELRYDDILVAISHHAEQRDIHIGIRQQMQGQESIITSIERLTSIVLGMQASNATERALDEGARIEFRQQLLEIQLVQLLDHVKVTQMPDPIKAFQASLFLSKKRRTRPSTRGPAFWLEDKVQRWNQSSTSSLSVAMLCDIKIPVIWALKTFAPEGRIANEVSSIDLLKYLVSQAIAVNKSIHTDAALAPCFKSYIGAQMEDEWVNILGSVLQGIPFLYIILDIEVLSQTLAGSTHDFWLAAFLRIFAELSSRGSKTVVRVALAATSREGHLWL
ncbi:hypothetical protein PG994_003354 [Apiospora phragmitis]|uniref:DUF7708 domain-containing protein n=1 Tax=Apiospora phragmitis TaxID=2905665 RepID=A0ABR1VXX9_9PEZI